MNRAACHRAFPFAGLVPLAGMLLLLVTAGRLAAEEASNRPWVCHAIDNSSRGADGVRLADVNGDGLPDIATGWEEGGLIRVYLNPGRAKAKQPWPAVTVGKVGRPEDAVFADLDGDGATDVVSCCEGGVKSVFVHWAPSEKGRYLDPAAWKTEAFPALAGQQLFVFCLPLQVDGRHGVDLVIGSKTKGGQIGWLECPADARDLAAWKWHPLGASRWVMSLMARDLDGDGDADILASDRDGAHRGCLWLENPGSGAAQTAPWKSHRIGPEGVEATFLDLADFDADGMLDVVAPSFARQLWFHRRTAAVPPQWESSELPYPEPLGFARSARVADIDLDGKLDVALTSRAPAGQTGAVWISAAGAARGSEWKVFDISGPAGEKGLKLDIIELLDLDGDGDLDLVTTEEHTGLGVIWYENPTRVPQR
jgi:hypothetical protein